MKFLTTADTDIGISKDTNQDSVLVKHASFSDGEVVMAIICDGMGGLSKGELASSTVIREFAKWFDNELPNELNNINMEVIGGKWSHMLKSLNSKILDYGKKNVTNLGTTFSGILLINDKYVIAHVGDSRVYQLTNKLTQLTQDQTFIAREIAKGTLTPEQAKTDKRRNMLLQCVGASKTVEPQVICGKAENGAYMLCSDGFRHEISEKEIYGFFNPKNLINKDVMHKNSLDLIDKVKSRGEQDNISVILIKAN